MGRKGEVRATIKGRLEAEDLASKALLLYAMRNFRDAVEFAHNLLKKGLKESDVVKLVTSRILNNSHYAHSALVRAKLYADRPYLKLKKPQLFSVGKSNERGNRNVRFLSTDRVLIKISHANGKHEFVEFKVRFGRKYLPIVKELTEPAFAFSAGVSADGERYHIYVQVPMDVYRKHMPIQPKRYGGKYLASFDLNSDRICMVIVDRRGVLIDVKNKHFPEVVNYPKEKARDIRRKALKELFEYALNHDVRVFVVEDLEKSNTKIESKIANRKISRFALREYLDHLRVLVGRAGVELCPIKPHHSTTLGKLISKFVGIDIHTASAYALALKFLNTHER